MSGGAGREARFCPACGARVGTAKFCPECGAHLRAVRRAACTAGSQGSPAAARGGMATPADARRERGSGLRAGAPARRPSSSASPSARVAVPARPPGLPRWVLLGGAGVALAIIVAVVVVATNRSTSPVSRATASTPASTNSPAAGVSPVPADTSGSYQTLVRRANGLYDKGAKAFAASDLGKTVAYFAAAAEVYQAAWKKKPGDPGVGTDWATSQFYAGDVARALGTIQMVLATNPDYQPALYNKGNFLAHAALLATESGQTAAAAALKERAKAAYEQAAKVDPSSDLGKRAARAAAQL